MKKKQIMGIIEATAKALNPDEIIPKVIENGLRMMDSEWLYPAMEAFKTLNTASALSEEKKRNLETICDPWLPMEQWLEENPEIAERVRIMSQSMWDIIEKYVSSPAYVKEVLMRKPENRKYLAGEWGDKYVEWAAQRIYNEFYDWVWSNE